MPIPNFQVPFSRQAQSNYMAILGVLRVTLRLYICINNEMSNLADELPEQLNVTHATFNIASHWLLNVNKM